MLVKFDLAGQLTHVAVEFALNGVLKDYTLVEAS